MEKVACWRTKAAISLKRVKLYRGQEAQLLLGDRATRKQAKDC